jgi:hypothetical protein
VRPEKINEKVIWMHVFCDADHKKCLKPVYPESSRLMTPFKHIPQSKKNLKSDYRYHPNRTEAIFGFVTA